MNILACIKFLCPRLRLLMFLVFLGILFSVSSLPGYAWLQGQAINSRQDAEDSGGWIFNQAPYTNNPQTGDRVWQYKAEKTPYRDPYAAFDSPHVSFPFEPDSYDSFFYGYPFYSSGMWPLSSPYSNATNANGLFPYDGDPND